MKRKKYASILLGLLLFAQACAQGTDNGADENAQIKRISIQTNQTHQVIDGFAASDCWTVNYVGNYWSTTEKEAMARLLFSNEVVAGQPQGIALSMWRFNLGGGTAEQGDASGIGDLSRRAECFLQADGSYNWNKHLGQQYFLQKAKDYGCEQFVLFSNTPPVSLTLNGKGYSAMGAWANLKEDAYGDFARYMATVLNHFKTEKNIRFSLVSPVNEPQHNWEKPSQEGTAWQNSEVKRLVTELDAALTNQVLDTKILLSEAADWEYVYKQKGDAGRSNVINDLFLPSSSNYVGNLSHVAPIIGGHSYWIDTDWTVLKTSRNNVATAATAAGLKVYQTEWSLLSDNYGDGYPGHDKASYMDIALVMAKVLHADLTMANASSWSFWTSMDMERWGHKSRFLLLKITPAGGVEGDIRQSGTHEATKNLWVLGNYSRFIRPGYSRVTLDIENASNLFLGSAYLSPDQKTLAVVYTNLSARNLDVQASISGVNASQVRSIKTYTTNQTLNLKETVIANGTTTLNIPTQSVVTVVYEL